MRLIPANHPVRSLSFPLSRCAQIPNSKANRNFPEMRIRLCAGDVRKVDDLFTHARIDPGDGQIRLKFFGVPELARGDERPFIASGAGASGPGFTRAGDREPFDGVCSQSFARQSTCSLVVRSFWSCFEIGLRFVFAKNTLVRFT
jgi:hypothetical protein